MRFRKTSLALAVSVSLSACGGDGGGPSATLGSFVRSEVPYHTPVRVAVIDPLTKVDGASPIFDTFNADITGSGADIIAAGRMTQYATVESWSNSKISLLSWSNGSLVDRTAQWFPGGINEILGTEPSVKFADFFNTGRTDMFVAPSTDMRHYGPAHVFVNSGSNFSRIDLALNDVWAHDSAVGDLNGDGFKDIVIVDYGPNTTVALNNRINNFTVYTDVRGNAGDLRWGGSGITVDDFLGIGGAQIIVTDNSCNTVDPNCVHSRTTRMYTYSIDPATDQLNYHYHSDLPAPLLEHNVRVVSYDFNDDSVPDVIVFSRPSDHFIKQSAIQFLANNGIGIFTDVTDSTLVGYDTATHSTYNPKFLDFNGDGLTDILVSAWDFSGDHNSTQILLKSSDGKYVAAHQRIFTDFLNQTAEMTQNLGIGGDPANSTVNIFNAPDGKLYLTTMIMYEVDNDKKLAVYMSELGSENVITAQAAADLIKQKWPYMSSAQVNTVLAQTSATYFGGQVIDLSRALNPVGMLQINTAQGLVSITGSISGVRFSGTNILASDSLDRHFVIDVSPMNRQSINSFDLRAGAVDPDSESSPTAGLANFDIRSHNGLQAGKDSRSVSDQYMFAYPKLLKKGSWAYGIQFTKLDHNPWLSLSGVWGRVRDSSVFDHMVSYQHNGFLARGSLMYVNTKIDPGLVTKVNDIYGYWGEIGYQWKTLSMHAGITPTVFKGSVEARLPDSIDQQGRLLYSVKNMDLQDDITSYAKISYSKQINPKTRFKTNTVVTSQGQYQITATMNYTFR
jgi:hypothetical protein